MPWLLVCALLSFVRANFETEVAKVKAAAAGGGQIQFQVSADDVTWAEKSPFLQHCDFLSCDELLYKALNAGGEAVVFFYAPKHAVSTMMKPSLVVSSLMTDPKRLAFFAIDCTMSGNWCAEKGVHGYGKLRHYYNNRETFTDLPIIRNDGLQLVEFVASKLGKELSPRLRKEILEVTSQMQKKEEAAARAEADKARRDLEKQREQRIQYLSKREDTGSSHSNAYTFMVARGTEVKEVFSWTQFRKDIVSNILTVFYLGLDETQSGVAVENILPVTALNVTLAVIACDKKDNDRLCAALNKGAPRQNGALKFPIVRFYKGKGRKGKLYNGEVDEEPLLAFVKKEMRKKKIKLKL